MMKEFSMHVMDIAQNSIRAEANHISIELTEDSKNNVMTMRITDNGCGMDEETVKAVRNPFKTSRTTRKVGLGIPMIEQTCVLCDGFLEIKSEPSAGCEVFTSMRLDHIDRPPMGDIIESIFLLIIMNPQIDFVYTHEINGKSFRFDTREIRDVLGDVPFDEPEIATWINDTLKAGFSEITI